MEKIRHHSRNYCSQWRRSKLGKTKPNHLYFARLIKKETEDYLRENKSYLLTYKPETYYAMKNQKLPKKYQKKQRINIAPVNAFIPPQSKLSEEELQKQMEKESELQKEKEAKAYEDSFTALGCFWENPRNVCLSYRSISWLYFSLEH